MINEIENFLLKLRTNNWNNYEIMNEIEKFVLNWELINERKN